MLEEDGGLRWSRLENLMQESSKSVDYDASQLWLLAGRLLLVCLIAVEPTLCVGPYTNTGFPEPCSCICLEVDARGQHGSFPVIIHIFVDSAAQSTPRLVHLHKTDLQQHDFRVLTHLSALMLASMPCLLRQNRQLLQQRCAHSWAIVNTVLGV